MEPLERRELIRLLSGSVLVVGATAWAWPTHLLAAQTASDQLIFNKYFKFEVKGIYNEVPGTTSVSGGDLTIAVEESTRGDRPDHREYTYGSHEYGDLTFTVQTGPGMIKLQEWADKAMKVGGGDASRRRVRLHLLGSDMESVRRVVTYEGCLPKRATMKDGALQVTCSVQRVTAVSGPGKPKDRIPSAPGLEITVDGKPVAASKLFRRARASTKLPPFAGRREPRRGQYLELVTHAMRRSDPIASAAADLVKAGREAKLHEIVVTRTADTGAPTKRAFRGCLLVSMTYPRPTVASDGAAVRRSLWLPQSSVPL